MTVTSTNQKVSFNGDGSTTVFAYNYKIFAQTDLLVILRVTATGTETKQFISTNYSVSGVGTPTGGNVTMGTAPASGTTLTILRVQPNLQGLDLVPNDPFPAGNLEASLDKLTFMVQTHEEEIRRSIKASKANTISTTEFSISASDRANKVFSFDSLGDLNVTQELGTFRGSWAASTAYVQRDLVKDTTTNNIFIAKLAHTSSGSEPITTNTDAAKWALLLSPEDVVGNLVVPGDLSVGDDVKLTSDAAVLGFGVNNDVTLTHVHDTGLLLNGTRSLQFNDASQFIHAPSATVLDINATDEIELNATLIDVNGNLDVSGTITLGSGAVISEAELEMLDGITAGTVAASKAVVVDANKDASSFRNLTASGAVTAGSLVIGSADIAEAELEMLDGITAGTALASKAMVLDSAKDITGGRNLTITGELDAGSLDISGDIDVDGTANLDVVDIDGAVNMATTALVTGVLTTTASTVFNGGFTANDGSTISTADNTAQLTLISTDADSASGPYLDLYRNSGSPANGDALFKMEMRGRNNNSQDVIYGKIDCTIEDVADGTEDAQMIFRVMSAGTQRNFLTLDGRSEVVINQDSQDINFRVESDGNDHAIFVDGGNSNVVFGESSASVTSLHFNVGTGLDSHLYLGHGSSNANKPVLFVNRNANDGQLVQFRQANAEEGNISVSGSTVSYNGFAGRHESSGIATNTAVGTVVSTIDELDVYPDTQPDSAGGVMASPKAGQTRADHAKVKVSDSVGDNRVYGVVDTFETSGKVNITSVGIGSVRVTGACVGGDLLESNGDGTAKVQSDDIVRSKTIGKVTIGNTDASVKLVSCVMYCG